LACVGIFRVPSSVPGVNPFLRVQEEDHKRQVVIEIEQIQVQLVDARQPDPDELVGNIFEAFQTDNLPVKFQARRSRHAAYDDHERFAALSRQVFALLKTGNPSVLGGLLVPASRLSQQTRNGQSDNPNDPKDDSHCHVPFPSAGFWPSLHPKEYTAVLMSSRREPPSK
jgi:hypothetical protein